jgi:hypothetical protein
MEMDLAETERSKLEMIEANKLQGERGDISLLLQVHLVR